MPGSSNKMRGCGTERRRSERDAELRRRRRRQLSQALERSNRLSSHYDLEFPPLVLGEQSSSSTPSSATETMTSAATAQTERDVDIDEHMDTLFASASPSASSLTAMHNPANHHTDVAVTGALSPRSGLYRSRSGDASSQTTESITRTMSQMQQQLDSMRALLHGTGNGHMSDAVRHPWGSLREGCADFEDDLLAMMDDDELSQLAYLRRGTAGVGIGDRQRRTHIASRKTADHMIGEEGADSQQHGKMAAFVYHREKAATGSDVWPDMRDAARLPAKFAPVDLLAPGGTMRSTRSRPQPAQYDPAEDEYEDEDSQTLIWPMNQLPSEIYYIIADSLSRDDIKAMRLTCKEMEHHISGILFKTVVVPFNADIYGMLQGLSPPQNKSSKGKGKAKADDDPRGNRHNYAVDVFKSFGRSMKRFGMSFEVEEEVLANPPVKGSREDHKSYWGVYQWPYPEYKRFDEVAGLEDAADETPKMKTAFSFLAEVQELALSLDAGLGWLKGPDQSLRSRVLGSTKPVFGVTHPVPDRREEARQWLWQHLRGWADQRTDIDLRHCTIGMQKLSSSQEEHAGMTARMSLLSANDLALPFLDLAGLVDPSAKAAPLSAFAGNTVLQSGGAVESQSISNPAARNAPQWFEGGLLTVKEDAIDLEKFEHHQIVPSELSQLQKEWLLETEWAQRAFLSSWLIAVVDNRLTFEHVHVINFARISSRFLLSLCREDLWRALPHLNRVILNVIPDCRDVVKDNAGFVEAPRILPIAAHWLTYKLVLDMLASRSTVKNLELGWATGGEHEQGLTARNKHVMPAPLLSPEWLTTAESMVDKALLGRTMLKLPYVTNLTLRNCWITPHALTFLVREHTQLRNLCLESVSLTAELAANNVLNANQVVALAQQVQAPLPPHGPQAVAQHLQLGGHNNHHGLLQALQNVNNLAAAAGIHLPNTQQNVATTDWLNPRSGSWPHVLDAISPGVTLAASGCVSSPANLPATLTNHALHTLDIKSAGYCRLNNARLDESTVPPPTYGGGSPWFTKRHAALSKVMLSTRGHITADIVQVLPTSEEHALVHGFDLQPGWPKEWRDEVDAPTFDACLPGGTGRFSGILTASSRVEPVDE